MASKDLHSDVKVERAFNLQTVSTDTTTAGNTIDTYGYEAVEFGIATGTVTDGDYNFQLFEGDASDMSDETQVTSTDSLRGTLPNWTADNDDNKLHQVGYVGTKRYLRLKCVSTNTSSGAVLGAVVALGEPLHGPITASEET